MRSGLRFVGLGLRCDRHIAAAARRWPRDGARIQWHDRRLAGRGGSSRGDTGRVSRPRKIFSISLGAVFCWGNIFSLFPAMCADLFGPQYATANLSVLYTAKGVGAFLVPLGTVLVASTGSWDSVLLLGAGINVVATILALAVLRPAENRHHTDEQQGDLMQSALAGRPS